ncbi:MAG: hypothetical protein V4710_16500 [Verrucomicrobiota bacterium]
MARKTVRVEIPVGSPNAMIRMATELKKRHDKVGPASPLKAGDVQAMGERAEQAQAKRMQAEELEAQAGRLRGESDTLIGIAPGQSVETRGTLLHDLTGFRDLLLVENRGNEQALSEYGFEVVIGTASSPNRLPRKDPTPGTGTN